jgi:kynurenine formamidase
MLRTVTLLVGAAIAGCSPPPAPEAWPAGEIVDLSHPYDEQTIFWPTSETFRLEQVAEGITAGGYYYAANNFFTAEHGGTHLDAPIHFAEGRPTVDRVPLDRLMGPAVVVDVTDASEQDADYLVSVEDLLQSEEEEGRIPEGAIVLLRTGFSARWPDAIRYLGTARRGEEAVAELHFPGLHPDAARWLVENRSIDAIGIDTASIDRGQSQLFESHRILSEAEIPAFENLTSLDRLPARGAIIIALPMKIGGGSGAPLRAVAVLPEQR